MESCPLYHLIDVLLHEYAHAISWPYQRLNESTQDHSAQWGIALSTVYSAFYEGEGERESNECKW